MAVGNWGGFAWRNGVTVPGRSDASVWADGRVSSIWDPTTLIETADAIGGGHVVLGDGPVYFALYKHYLEVFDQTGIQYRSVEAADWQWEYDEQTHRFVVDGHVVDHRVVVFDRSTLDTCAVLHVRQPDGTHWHGFCGLSIGTGFSGHQDARQTKRAIRTMRRTFKEQWKHWASY